jgi:HlyB family type I secretion system ABC transporter
MPAPVSLSKLLQSAPFDTLPTDLSARLQEQCELVRYELGARLLSLQQLPPGLLIVLQGEVRLMASLSTHRTITLERRGPGQLLGWVSLLRGMASELVQASETCVCLLVPAELFLQACRQCEGFLNFFASRSTPSELASVLLKHIDQLVAPPADEESWLRQAIERSRIYSVCDALPANLANDQSTRLLLSTACDQQSPRPGSLINGTEELPRSNSGLPLRLLSCPAYLLDPYTREESQTLVDPDGGSQLALQGPQNWLEQAVPAEEVLNRIASAESLGLVAAEDLLPQERYAVVRGKGALDEARATIQALAERLQVPFPREVIERVLRQQLKRRQVISLELLAALCELLGLQTRLGTIRADQVAALDFPVLAVVQGEPLLLHGLKGSEITLASPRAGLMHWRPEQLLEGESTQLRVLLVQRTSTTKTDRFGWRWFLPLLSKYRTALLVSFLATFAAQLATLAIPLLMQQIIDKTLSQGNISSLNVLGGALVVVALFQALLSGLNTFVFKDTANRMDLQLGATVMDRLLRLPLPYFDRRPVGELSQRLGEMANIRSFLTGTAITSLMDLVFSSIYLVVMLLYSPLLSAVALSTLPVYILMVVVVAPLYKSLIRKQAVASARSQSHIIEVLGAIQTVKAQNVELVSRWKWQDRYQDVVEEGFKAVTVGTVSGQIGNFLNTLSGLLILWVGMTEVIQGNITLGQLIAFRIIAGYVTGPLLRLSNLYQGFQQVGLSFERLGDIINQQPEASESGAGQIALPPIEGEVRYDGVSFRFGPSGPLQLDSVDLHIPPGEFVGVAGLSGSGKSTLMKLLARLYPPLAGRVLIDGYDIAKVDLNSLRQQVGIVPQDSLLFEGSVRDNLTLGRPEASTEEIIEAARIACAHDFIMELPDGYNTAISEKGSNLSGGQRQRIAIARTLLCEPRLLVMDEATSALDYQTEAQVCANLREHLLGRTVFFITHRLGTIRGADRIVLMYQGRIVEQGRHGDLMAAKGRYYALYRQQEAGVEE